MGFNQAAQCVDPQEPHAETTPGVVADVDGIAVDDLQHECRRSDGISGYEMSRPDISW